MTADAYSALYGIVAAGCTVVAASCWLHIGKELRSVGLKTGRSNIFTDHRLFMRYAPTYGWNSRWGTMGVVAFSAAVVFLTLSMVN
ncbi:MAG TPA: hypothetical protein VMB18_13050 [Terriglobales bacterium]|nr:hypothetical protein [Terriglobales bacterium]